VRKELDGELRAKLGEKGYVLLGWGDVGPIHLFSNTPVKSRADLLKTKLWEWVDDPVSRAMFKRIGVRGVPLGAPDVLPSLSTGMIDAAFGTPLAVLALQWHGKVKYMSAMQMGFALGATVITRRELDKLSPAEQQVLLADAKALEQKLLLQVRSENDRALATLKKSGLAIVDSPAEMQAELQSFAKPLREDLEPSLYSRGFRERVEAMVAKYRQRTAHR
jgi:TRAP-type transport system periplasmic protein